METRESATYILFVFVKKNRFYIKKINLKSRLDRFNWICIDASITFACINANSIKSTL